jgi:Tol biopolymer transport system component
MRIAGVVSAPIAALMLLALPMSACGTRTTSGPSGTIAVTGGSLHTERQIVLISPASRVTRRVTAPDDVVRLDISPDGSRIALTGFTGIWVMQPDGSDARRILVEVLDEDHPFGAGEIAWAPDGRRLVFARSDDSLFTISADGKNRKRLVDHADQPDWSAHGEEIVFVQNPEQSGRAGIIAAIGNDGRGLRRIVDRGRWGEPRVSPDGATVAFANKEGVFLASMEGGDVRLFIRNGYRPAWSPDGNYLAFTRSVHCDEVCTSRVLIVPATGGRARAYGPAIGDIGPLSWGE